MNLPERLTTVTPFSKYLAMVLFILFPFLGFYLGMQYQKSLSTISQQRKIPCTLEVKQCPDGSHVGRGGLDCSFATCPQIKKTPQDSVEPTIIPSSQQGWSTYIDRNKLYSFNFPSIWNVNVEENSEDPAKPWVRLYYMENGQRYTFEIGQGGHGVVNTDNIVESQITISGQSFDQKVFYQQGTPLFISVVPNSPQIEQKYFNHISIELPAINTNASMTKYNYIATFNEIISSLQFIGQRQAGSSQSWQQY